MLEQPVYAATAEETRDLVAARGWATLVSGGRTPVVSHLPYVMEGDDPADLTVQGHLARADADLHELGGHEVVLVVEGPDGYISPTFYAAGTYVPTWNFVVAHLHGTPELLDEAETWSVLERTVERFEAERPEPWRLDSVDEYARSIAPYTTGFRLAPTRVVGKVKLNQDKPDDIVARVVTALESDAVHGNPALARAMRSRGLGGLSEATKPPERNVGDPR